MFADESDEVCRLCYHLSSTFTEGVGRITASDQTVRAVHSCISWLNFTFDLTDVSYGISVSHTLSVFSELYSILSNNLGRSSGHHG